MKKTKFAYLLVLVFLFALSACDTPANEVANLQIDTPNATQAEASDAGQTQPESATPPPQVGPLTFGSAFQFNGSSGRIELTFGTDVFWGEVENSWSEHYGATVFAIPVTIQNISNSTGGLNPFDFTLFGSNGLSLSSVGSWFDYDIAWESNMRAGASKTGLFHFLYDGDGEYVIEFSAGFGFGDSNEVIFEIENANGLSLTDFNIDSFPPSTFIPLSIADAFTLGDTFEFNGSSGEVEITLGTDISWMEVTNQWSQHIGAIVFSVPISVTNIGSETGGLNPFDFNMFGSDGLRLDSVGSSFDTDITWEGNMRPGATQTGSLYFLYVGDGQYAIEFASGFGLGNLLEVIFSISRP